MRVLFMCFALLLVTRNLAAQESIKKTEDAAARIAQTNSTGVTYSYDGAGSRIKRVGGASSGCVNTWSGNVSAQWNTAGNWSLGVVPEPCHTVVIPSLTGKPYPILNINTTIYNVDFAGGDLNMNGFDITLSPPSSCSSICP